MVGGFGGESVNWSVGQLLGSGYAIQSVGVSVSR